LLLGHGGGGRPIPAAIGGKVGRRRGARATQCGGETGGGTSERRAHRRGSFHGGATRLEGNCGEGRRLVVVVGGSRLGMVVGTRAIVGVASTERKSSR
jgi:hypothetical protein